MKKLLACLGLMMAVSLSAGCTLYFGEDDNSWDCPPGSFAGEDDWGNATCVAGGGDGFNCASDNQCASGCYCDDAVGTCAEAGFCATDTDCGYGFECDCSSSCVPLGTETRTCGSSCFETGCPFGTVCAADGSCVPEQPPACTDDTTCAAGCFCLDGRCEESSVCTSDADCPADQHCDTTRSTCIPGAPIPDPVPSCAGEITCAFGAPTCPAGQVPLILEGCWTGACAALESCTAAPTCAVINTETQCLGRGDCGAIYSGQNCTNPSGEACTMGQSGCTCETFTFDRCAAD